MTTLQKPQPQSSAEYFEEKRYVLLEGAIDKALCKELSDRLHSLVKEGLTERDPQCPKSDSIYGDEVLDRFLADMAEPISENLGIELIPTYTYARVYRPGEVLAPHTDRPSCEISGTMTLGFDAETVWPIYFGLDADDKVGRRVDLDIGSLLMYRGEELPHWRKEFKGNWQCQVFFHYIDANGPHKDKGLAFDGRETLGTSSATKTERIDKQMARERSHAALNPVGDDIQLSEEFIQASLESTVVPPKEQSRTALFPIHGGIMIPSWDLETPGTTTYTQENYPALTFTPDECQAIIDLSKVLYPEAGSVGGGEEGVVSNIRVVDLYNVPMNEDTRWVFDRLARLASLANNEYYNFEIMGITHELQLLHYKTEENPGHYDWHMDIGSHQASTRKISMSVQLSDPSTYTGGELLLNNSGQFVVGTKERGAVTCFPSYFLHKVNPMAEGERWALVIWVHGSNRFR